jgi:hypothetical protein
VVPLGYGSVNVKCLVIAHFRVIMEANRRMSVLCSRPCTSVESSVTCYSLDSVDGVKD